MEILSTLDYWFWVPVLFWIGLFFWFYRVSYPTYLKKLLRKGQKWVFIPVFKFFWKPCDVLFTLIVSVSSVLPTIWVLNKWTDLPLVYAFAEVPLFLILGAIVCSIAKKRTANLYRSAYFLEYRRVRYESESKGNFRSEADVHNQTIWRFTKNLKKAESRGRLWKYVNAMAKTKKIPRDILAETMYG